MESVGTHVSVYKNNLPLGTLYQTFRHLTPLQQMPLKHNPFMRRLVCADKEFNLFLITPYPILHTNKTLIHMLLKCYKLTIDGISLQ